MAMCIMCGKEGNFTKKIVDEFPDVICDDCNSEYYWIKKDPTSEANASQIRAITRRAGVSKEARGYLLGLIGEDPALLEAMVTDEEEIARLVRSMPITSGYNIEGYKIVRYGGYVSGDEVASLSSAYFLGLVQVGTGYTKDTINDAIIKVRRTAISELKRAAAEIGCNAIIGLDFDYINIDRTHQGSDITHIILTANGTAVEIEPIE